MVKPDLSFQVCHIIAERCWFACDRRRLPAVHDQVAKYDTVERTVVDLIKERLFVIFSVFKIYKFEGRHQGSAGGNNK